MKLPSYEVELFRSEGFQRKKCPDCGSFFWTVDPGQKTCGDPPCADYTFIGKSPMKRAMDSSDVREAFLGYFEKNGHTRIGRYPVVSRWRDDIYYTIASIACFQPWVLNGVSEPPANPLTMSQPSIRFNDIDNVGKTGRHFTEFEMMAHHCFNTKKKQVYFKDKTVELSYGLLRGLGIKPEKISYKEAWWEGGGNAGPCFEVLIEGAELATLVFMQYDGPFDGKYKEMDMTVVDTGYGLERFAWVSQGTPTAYDAMFPEFIKDIRKISGIHKVDKRIMSEYAKHAGVMNIETAKDISKLREDVAKKIKISKSELTKHILPWEHVYAIADHSKSLAFMITDGVVPSNVKEGYFARLVIRRMLRSIKALGMSTPLSEIMALAVKYQTDFPELQENVDTISEIMKTEEVRFGETIEKGRRLVERKVETFKKKGVDRFPLDALIEMYDSHGLPPFEVEEFAGKDITVDIPDDFYVKVAAAHSEAEAEEAEKNPVEEASKRFKPTKAVYYDEPYRTELEATVLGTIDKKFVVLDKTIFYPEGGGQPADKGLINGERVINVQKYGEVIVHQMEKAVNLKGKARCALNWDRRLALMQNHTATHLVNAAAQQVLGRHVWQAGAQKHIDRSRLDITHYARVDENELKKIEAHANHVVSKNVKVTIERMERGKAESKYGFRLYQGGVVPGKEIRVVSVEDIDVEACAGTHCSWTGEIGLIKLLRAERIQDGVVRLEFAAGNAAIKHMQEETDTLRQAAEAFSVPPNEVPNSARRFFKEWSDRGKEIERLQTELAGARSHDLKLKARRFGRFRLISDMYPKADIPELQKIADLIAEDPDAIVALAGVHEDNVKLVITMGDNAADMGADANEIMKKVAKVVEGGGGGTPVRSTGGGPKVGKTKEALDRVISEAKDALAKKSLYLRLLKVI